MRSDVVERINSLAVANNGRIRPEVVLADARDPSSPLHGEFEWDDAIAAEAHRLDKARQLIRSVRIEYKVNEVTVSAVRFVRDPQAERNSSGYIDVRTVKNDKYKDSARDVLLAEASRIRAMMVRMRELARFFDLAEDFDEMINRIDDMKSKVDGFGADGMTAQ